MHGLGLCGPASWLKPHTQFAWQGWSTCGTALRIHCRMQGRGTWIPQSQVGWVCRAGGIKLAKVSLLRWCWTGQQHWPGPEQYQKQASGQRRWTLLGPSYPEFLHFWATQNYLSGGFVDILNLYQGPQCTKQSPRSWGNSNKQTNKQKNIPS